MNPLIVMLVAMTRQRFRSLTNPLIEVWQRRRYRNLAFSERARPLPETLPAMAGGSDTDPKDLIEHYRGKLDESIATAQKLSDETSKLLSDGATLDDEKIVELTEKRADAHTAIDSYRKTLETEVSLSESRQTAYEMLEGAPKSAWAAPAIVSSRNETLTKTQDGPTPFDSFGHQLMAIKTAALTPHATDPHLAEIHDAYALGLSEGVPSEGGFLVQVDFAEELLKRIHDTGKLFSIPKHIPLSERASGLKINAVDETSRVDGSRLGGVQAYWTAEAATITKSKPTFRQIELSLHKLAALYYATEEELQDTVALEETTSSFFSEEMAFKLDDALIRGSGAGEPLGILGHAGTVSIAKESGQGAKTIIVKNIEKMYTQMWARSIASATWYINQDCWLQLFALEKVVGTGGVPVFLPAGGLSGAPFGTLLGRPIEPIEHCETLGTEGDIILADFASGYVMIDKGGIKAASSMHVQFLTDEMVFRFTLRTDGQPIANAALTPYKGSADQSAFITLADR